MKKKVTRLFSVLLAAVLVFGTLPVSALGTDATDPPASTVDEPVVDKSVVDGSSAEPEEESAVDDAAQLEEQSAEVEAAAVQSAAAVDGYTMNIFFLDCGRKYYSASSIKQFIDNASSAGFNYIQLAVGNDGLRFLLDNMELTVNGKTYGSNDVKAAIQTGNRNYYNFTTNELTQSEMDEIISYAHQKGMGVIPCVNSPGHMDAILDAAEELTGMTCSYSGSGRTIDVTNSTATTFTQALLQKYIDYFASKGCQYFNMGADEYANDKFTGGAMGFGNLLSTRNYGHYVDYVNQVAALIKGAGMKPMAFNDGIYFQNNTSYGTFDTDIVICYWSNGWSGYTPMPAADLAAMGFKLVNTHGDYYWVLGKSDAQCSATKASRFAYNTFPGSVISAPVGSMFCVWGDYPGAESEASVINKTAATIAAFGRACPTVDPVTETPTTPSKPDTDKPAITAPEGANALKVNGTTTLEASETVTWKAEPEGVVDLTSADDIVAASSQVSAKKVAVKALKAGKATITATNDAGKTAEFALEVTAAEDTGSKTDNVTVVVGGTKTANKQADGDYTGNDKALSNEYVDVTTEKVTTQGTTYYEPASFEAGKEFYISAVNNAADVTDKNAVKVTFETAENGQYYIKLADGSYIYPNASYGWRTGWSYSLGETQMSVTVAPDGNGIAVSRAHTYEGMFNTYNTNAYLTLSGTTFGADSSSQMLYLYTQKTTPGTTTTKVSFTGKKVTEENKPTTIVIGNVTYNVTVTDVNLSDVAPLEIQYWITNSRLIGASSGKNYYAVAAENAYSEAGLDVAGLVDQSANKDGRTQTYWQAKLLDKTKSNNSTSGTEEQTGDKGDDETLNGTTFTKVRYWGGKWQVYSEAGAWIEVTSNHQVVAYYMEVVNIKNANGEDEMTINAADWGTKGDGTGNWGYTPENDRCSVSVQVVYEDGSKNPGSTDAANLKSKTIVYGYPSSGRGLGTMVFTGNNEYEIYKITAETGTMRSSASGSNTVTVTSLIWKGNEKVVWGGDDQEPVASASIGNPTNNPSYENPYDNLAWNTSEHNKNNAILIRVYVKPKANEDSLTVHYVNQTTGSEFYSYNISVTAGTYFNENFARVSDTELTGNTVRNKSGVDQTVEADLKNMAAIGAEYRYSEYKCVDARRDAGGKDVYLYYTFDRAVSFVVDFGTSLKINLTDLSETFNGNEEKINSITVKNQTNGKADVNFDTKTITYTPNANFVKNSTGEMLNVTVSGYNPETRQTGEITYTVYIYPASNVLYEESFLSKPDGDTTWSRSDAAAATQETQKLGDTTKNYNVFGYDGSYSSSTNANGVWSISGLKKNEYSAPLTTEFYGNTFDLIGDCGPTTGGVLLTVIKNGANGKHATIANIDTRYDDGSGATIHQVPLAHIVMANKKYGYDDALCTVKVYATGLDPIEGSTAAAVQAAAEMDADAEYDALLAQILEENDLTMDEVDFVTISAADNLDVAATPDAVDFYSATYASDGTGSSGYQAGNHVEIDGFRVYRSTTDTVAENYPDNEKGKTYKNIWGVAEGSFVGFTDKKREVTGTVQDYIANGGPQNEIYLTKSNDQNHAVVFKIGDTKSTIQVSLRAVKDNDPVTVNLGNEVTKTITSVTEMYYEVTSNESGVFTIANTGDGILAIGNVKLPSDNQIISAQELGDEVVSKALTAALYGNAEPEPDPATFAPETFETKVSSSTVIRNKVVTLKVTVSSDVAYITVNGKKYTRTGLKGFGGKNRTIRVVSVMPKDETPSFEIVAYNANGEKSETKTVSK